MCLARVYDSADPQANVLMENVASIELVGQQVTMTSLFGDTIHRQASIVRVDLAKSRITLEYAAGEADPT